MKLDRSAIKSQAKQLISGKVFGLFLITIVVGFCAGEFFDAYGMFGEIFGYDISDVLEQFRVAILQGDLSGLGSILDNAGSRPSIDTFGNYHIISRMRESISLVTLFLAPLGVALAGLFVQIIRGSNMDTGNYFQYVFNTTFNKNYGRKLLFTILKDLIIIVGFILFVIPGIVLTYRYYFADMIMAEYPLLSPKQALDISKKMTNGHKGELFILDLSFLAWWLLCAISAGLASIYVLPYVNTVKALYYENFRVRCIQDGVITGIDFMVNGQQYPQPQQTDAPQQQQ